jgi:2-phospho-L-lactate/phosphoenolpyruvate guanylyltransferase
MASRSGPRTVQCSAPDAVPLRFGENSFYPHLDAARARGIEPLLARKPGIGMDIDHPVDLVAFLRMAPRVRTRTLDFLEQSGGYGDGAFHSLDHAKMDLPFN